MRIRPYSIKHLSAIFFLLLLTVSVSVSFAQDTDAAVGTWFSEGKESKIEIYKNNGRYFGKIAWVQRTNEDGSPVLDVNNPDEKLRSRKIAGIVIMRDFKHAGKNVWEDGKIYDPKNGKTYSCKMTLISKNQLEVRGYVGISLIGRSTTWTRAE
jgi:uncharacterized protein (DUF2147 family)